MAELVNEIYSGYRCKCRSDLVYFFSLLVGALGLLIPPSAAVAVCRLSVFLFLFFPLFLLSLSLSLFLCLVTTCCCCCPEKKHMNGCNMMIMMISNHFLWWLYNKSRPCGACGMFMHHARKNRDCCCWYIYFGSLFPCLVTTPIFGWLHTLSCHGMSLPFRRDNAYYSIRTVYIEYTYLYT